MPTNHDAVAALPAVGDANKQLLRNTITARMPYVLADNENATDLIAVDPVSGSAIVDMTFLGRLFHYAPADMVTAHDGVTCLVSSDGRRYKLSDGSDVFCYSVLDRTRTVPPASPSLGDAHLVAVAATGAWVGKDGNIAVKTARGWEFIAFGVGRFVYVEDVDTYYHRNSGGAWVSGFGNQVIAPASIPLSAAINFGKRLIVENRTTTAPPGTVAVGVAYVIGPSATGAWAGQDGKIAICEVINTFTIYTPSNGWAAFDKSLNIEVRFDGTAWISSTGAVLGAATVYTASGNVSAGQGSGNYTFSSTTAPTTALFNKKDLTKLTYKAKAAGNRLRFEYTYFDSLTNSNITAMLIRGSESTALDWYYLNSVGFVQGTTFFEITASSDVSTDYYIFFVSMSNAVPAAPAKRRFSVMEFS